jgi:hypothetical protein
MFLRSYVYVDRPFEAVRRLVVTPPAAWTAGLDGDSGQELLAKVGVHVVGIPIYRHVRLHFPTAPISAADSVLLPVSWQVTGGQALFPEMQGDLHIAPFGPERTQITLSATYRPPFGALGEAIDRSILNRLGDATVHDFVRRLGDNIERLLRPAQPG